MDKEDMDPQTRIKNNCFLDPNWSLEDDCKDMTVPKMIMYIYKNRKSDAVAPNGYTTPFISSEEWTRIFKWIERIENLAHKYGEK